MIELTPTYMLKDMWDSFLEQKAKELNTGKIKESTYDLYDEARAGKSRFPAPLNGTKRKLLWSADRIARFCETEPASNGQTGNEQH